MIKTHFQFSVKNSVRSKSSAEFYRIKKKRNFTKKLRKRNYSFPEINQKFEARLLSSSGAKVAQPCVIINLYHSSRLADIPRGDWTRKCEGYLLVRLVQGSDYRDLHFPPECMTVSTLSLRLCFIVKKYEPTAHCYYSEYGILIAGRNIVEKNNCYQIVVIEQSQHHWFIGWHTYRLYSL